MEVGESRGETVVAGEVGVEVVIVVGGRLAGGVEVTRSEDDGIVGDGADVGGEVGVEIGVEFGAPSVVAGGRCVGIDIGDDVGMSRGGAEGMELDTTIVEGRGGGEAGGEDGVIGEEADGVFLDVRGVGV